MNDRFLLPALHVRIVLEARTKSKRRSVLGALSTELNDAFGSTIERIKQQPKDSADQAVRTLRWIHLAERPLSVEELLHALATEKGHSDLDRDNFPGRKTFLACCLGLAIVDDETSTVRLVHYSLEEYLNTHDQVFQYGHEYITQICLTYLLFESTTNDLASKAIEDKIESKGQNRAWTSKFALFQYATCHWGHHARKGYPLGESTLSLALEYLCMDWQKRHNSVRFLYWHLTSLDSPALDTQLFSSLHIVAFFGIHQVLSDIRLADSAADSVDSLYRTPLSWAARNGHEAVVKLLLEKGADPDSFDSRRRTPFLSAAANGQEAVVRLLLGKEIDPESRDSGGQSPLSWASRNGHEIVVKLLLEKDVDPDSADVWGRTRCHGPQGMDMGWW